MEHYTKPGRALPKKKVHEDKLERLRHTAAHFQDEEK